MTLGQKGCQGAIRSGLPPEVSGGFRDGGDDGQSRLLAATVDGVRVITAYAPNGQAVGSEKYAFKLEWYERLRKYLEREADPGRPLALAGDYNAPPADNDVHEHARRLGRSRSVTRSGLRSRAWSSGAWSTRFAK